MLLNILLILVEQERQQSHKMTSLSLPKQFTLSYVMVWVLPDCQWTKAQSPHCIPQLMRMSFLISHIITHRLITQTPRLSLIYTHTEKHKHATWLNVRQLQNLEYGTALHETAMLPVNSNTEVPPPAHIYACLRVVAWEAAMCQCGHVCLCVTQSCDRLWAVISVNQTTVPHAYSWLC